MPIPTLEQLCCERLKQQLHVSLRHLLPLQPAGMSLGFVAAIGDLLEFNANRKKIPNILKGRVNFQGAPHSFLLSVIEQYKRRCQRPAAFLQIELVDTKKRKRDGKLEKRVRLSINSFVHPELWVNSTLLLPVGDGDVSGATCEGRLSCGISSLYCRVTKEKGNKYVVRVDDHMNEALWLESEVIDMDL
jgi:hypothetical protein